MLHNDYGGQSQIKSTRWSDFLIISLFLVYILGSHLRVSIYSGGSIIVPMYLMLISSAILGFIKFKKYLKKTLPLLLVLFSFTLFQPFLSGGDDIYYRSSLQLLASVISASVVLFALKDVNQELLKRILFYTWLIFAFMAFLESLYLKSYFDLVRDYIYSGSGRFVYFEIERDLAIYGKVRSTVFASEPSYLADTMSALSVMVFMLSVREKLFVAWLYLVLMFLIGFYISPSFKMVFYFIAVVVWFFWPKNIKALLFLLLLVSFILAFVFILANVMLSLVLDVFGTHLTTGSFFGRIGSAHLVGINALAIYPFFGYGIGNSEQVYNVIVEVWNSTGAFNSFEFYQDLGSKDLMSNGFWWMWIYLGILGALIFFGNIYYLMRAIGNMMPWRSLVCASIVWYAGSAFIDPQSWFVVVVFSIATILNSKNSTQPVVMYRAI
ncbi:MAG: hypothetical protein RLZZ352_1426 [Pseudomonadota bacterium]|jgi:hypothetical protein